MADLLLMMLTAIFSLQESEEEEEAELSKQGAEQGSYKSKCIIARLEMLFLNSINVSKCAVVGVI